MALWMKNARISSVAFLIYFSLLNREEKTEDFCSRCWDLFKICFVEEFNLS